MTAPARHGTTTTTAADRNLWFGPGGGGISSRRWEWGEVTATATTAGGGGQQDTRDAEEGAELSVGEAGAGSGVEGLCRFSFFSFVSH